MLTAIYVGILMALVASAAMLASRAEHWRDPRWVGVLAILLVTVVFAFTVGHAEISLTEGRRTQAL